MPKIWSAGPGDDVGDEHLLREPDDEPLHAGGEVVQRDDSPRELVREVAVTDDRSGNQLRKEQQVERGMDGALLRRRVAAMDVDDVRDGVEGEEGDADRQQHPRHDDRPDAQSQEERVDVVGEEVRVFEHAEDREVHGDRQGEPAAGSRRSLGAMHRDRHPVVERDRSQHQPRERAAALGVEDDARDQQEPVAVGAVLPGAFDEIECEQDGQEEKEKGGLREQHGSILVSG